MSEPIKVLFVCHGNICRSPMAQFVLEDMVSQEGLDGRITVDSAATTNEELGNPPHYGTVEVLEREGIPMRSHRARHITSSDYEDFDFIIGMDRENMHSMERFFKGDPDHKLYKMLEFAGSERDVADPWYTGNFDVTFDDIHDGCVGLLHHIKRECRL